MGPLSQLHNIIVYIRSSAGRTKPFLEIVGRMIPLNNRTRWNSWYLMLVIALNYKAAINSYVEDHLDLEDDGLSWQDWTQLCTIKDFLAPFYRATLKTQGDNASIDKVLFTIDVLILWFEKSLVSKLILFQIEEF
jgi:hypothetical protein